MRIKWMPPGRVLVQFDPPEEKRGSLFIPQTAMSLRPSEIASVLIVGEAKPKEGRMFDLHLRPGDRVWVNPAFGDRWRGQSPTSGEIRAFAFEDIKGVVGEDEADFPDQILVNKNPWQPIVT